MEKFKLHKLIDDDLKTVTGGNEYYKKNLCKAIQCGASVTVAYTFMYAVEAFFNGIGYYDDDVRIAKQLALIGGTILGWEISRKLLDKFVYPVRPHRENIPLLPT